MYSVQVNNTLASMNKCIIFTCTHVCTRTLSIPIPQWNVHLLRIKGPAVLHIFTGTPTYQHFSTFYISSAEKMIYDL